MKQTGVLVVGLGAVGACLLWTQEAEQNAPSPAAQVTEVDRSEPELARLETASVAPVEHAHRTAVPTPTKALGSSGETELTVRLVDENHHPLNEGRVVVAIHDDPIAQQYVDADGRAEFRLRATGTCFVYVQPESLPQGFLEPRAQSTRARDWRRIPRDPETRELLCGVQVDLGETDAREITLAATRPAILSGRVLDPDGHPASYQQVEAFGRVMDGSDPPQLGNLKTDTDADGAFRVEVYPGRWSVSARVGQSEEAIRATWAARARGEFVPRYTGRYELRSLPQPPSQVVEVAAGGEAYVEIEYALGASTLKGQLVDQFGEPRGPGIAVSVFRGGTVEQIREGQTNVRGEDYITARATDEEGRFEIEGLSPGFHAINFNPPQGYHPLEKPGKNVFGRTMYGVGVDIIEGANEVTIEAPRSDPVRVNGVVIMAGDPDPSASGLPSLHVFTPAPWPRADGPSEVKRRVHFDSKSGGARIEGERPFTFYIERLVGSARIEAVRGTNVVLEEFTLPPGHDEIDLMIRFSD